MMEPSNLMEHDGEPVRGLPEPLPMGERLLWQGRPDWWALAWRGYHVRAVAIYFLILMAWRGLDVFNAGAGPVDALGAALWLLPLAAGAIGLLMGLAFLAARSTVYTLTSRRIVIRGGVAIQIAINIPYTLVGTAGFRPYPNGTGDIPLKTLGDTRISYIIMWPHVRPWRLGRPEPMLRAVPDAAKVADILAKALADRVSAEVPDVRIETALGGGTAEAVRRPKLVSVMGSARA